MSYLLGGTFLFVSLARPIRFSTVLGGSTPTFAGFGTAAGAAGGAAFFTVGLSLNEKEKEIYMLYLFNLGEDPCNLLQSHLKGSF